MIEFNMFVTGNKNLTAIRRALVNVQGCDMISKCRNLEHFVEWTLYKTDRSEGVPKFWFRIDASRPFLVWRIGVMYTKSGGS